MICKNLSILYLLICIIKSSDNLNSIKKSLLDDSSYSLDVHKKSQFAEKKEKEKNDDVNIVIKDTQINNGSVNVSKYAEGSLKLDDENYINQSKNKQILPEKPLGTRIDNISTYLNTDNNFEDRINEGNSTVNLNSSIKSLQGRNMVFNKGVNKRYNDTNAEYLAQYTFVNNNYNNYIRPEYISMNYNRHQSNFYTDNPNFINYPGFSQYNYNAHQSCNPLNTFNVGMQNLQNPGFQNCFSNLSHPGNPNFPYFSTQMHPCLVDNNLREYANISSANYNASNLCDNLMHSKTEIHSSYPNDNLNKYDPIYLNMHSKMSKNALCEKIYIFRVKIDFLKLQKNQNLLDLQLCALLNFYNPNSSFLMSGQKARINEFFLRYFSNRIHSSFIFKYHLYSELHDYFSFVIREMHKIRNRRRFTKK